MRVASQAPSEINQIAAEVAPRKTATIMRCGGVFRGKYLE